MQNTLQWYPGHVAIALTAQQFPLETALTTSGVAPLPQKTSLRLTVRL